MLPNPIQEQKVVNFHRNLARFVGRDPLIPLKDECPRCPD
jgi:hypothetical protein